jgi:predicted nucleotidyltransferase
MKFGTKSFMKKGESAKMATKQVTLKMEFTFEIDEDRLKEICEEQDIKFSKKKLKEAIEDYENNGYDHSELEELFEENFISFLAENYGE